MTLPQINPSADAHCTIAKPMMTSADPMWDFYVCGLDDAPKEEDEVAVEDQMEDAAFRRFQEQRIKLREQRQQEQQKNGRCADN